MRNQILHLNARQRQWVLTLVILYFTFLGGNSISDVDLAGTRIFHHVAVSLLMLGWAATLLLRRRKWPATPLDLPLLLFFAVNVLATIFAVDPRVSVEELWRTATHITFFYIVVDQMRSGRPRQILEPLFFASAVVIIVGFLEYLSWYTGLPPLPFFRTNWWAIGGFQQPVPPVMYRLSFTMLIATHLSAYMAVMILVGLGWAVSTYSKDTRQGLTLWLVGAFIVEILSFSRGGLLSLVVSVPLFAALVLIRQPAWWARITDLLRDRRVLIGAGVLVLAVIIGAGLWLRQADMGGHAAGDIQRWDLWRAGWQIGLHNPTFGVGPHGFGRAMREFRDPLVTTDQFTTPHNVPLFVWAELGLPGVLTLFGVVGTMLWMGFKRWRSAHRMELIRVSSIIAALIGFSIQSLFDTFLPTTPIMLPPIIFVAYLAYPLKPDLNVKPIHTRLIATSVLLYFLASGVGLLISDVAESHFQKSLKALEMGDLEIALIEIEAAERIDPALGIYSVERAQILGELAVLDPNYLPEALGAYATAVALEPTFDVTQANYALLLASDGQYASALEHMERAAAVRPREPRYMLWAGELASRLGQSNLAHEYYLNALEVSPSWITSLYWDATSDRMAAKRDLLTQVELPFDLELMRELPAYCWPTLDLPDVAHLPESTLLGCRATAALQNDDPEEAVGMFNEALGQLPTSAVLFAGRAEADVRIGDREAARRDGLTALLLGDERGYYTLGILAEMEGDAEAAEEYYWTAGPDIVRQRGWGVAVYKRVGELYLLNVPEFDAPGPSRYDFAPWLALADLLESQGKLNDAQQIYDAIYRMDPYAELE
jgi:tetratricopeptide (TPR) repeat protein/O-antigen ligase